MLPISMSSIQREGASKHGAPFVGFSVEGERPLAFRRKLLWVVADMKDASAWIGRAASGEIYLRVESADGKRKYSFANHNVVTKDTRRACVRGVAKEQSAFAARKRSSICRAKGWARTVEFRGDFTDADGTVVAGDGGERVTTYSKRGLTIKGSTVYHAASGKSVVVARNHAEAFTVAERALSIYDNWEQDSESLLAALGAPRLQQLRALRFGVKYSMARAA